MEVGIVCGRCDTYSAIGMARCTSCGNDLALVPRRGSLTRQQAAVAVGEALPNAMFADPLRPRRPSPMTGTPVHTSHLDKPASPLSLEELMDQAKNYVCKSC